MSFRAPSFLLPVLALALAAPACDSSGGGGGGGEEPLTCETLSRTTGNCWRTAVTEAYACASTSTDAGTFGADRATCGYDDGVTFAFDVPVPGADDPTRADYNWAFSINDADGGQCARFVDAGGSYTLTTASGTVSIGFGGNSATLVCQDGARYSTSNLSSLLDCDEGDFDLPGYQVVGGSVSVLFGMNAAPDGDFGLFDCR